MSERDSLQFPAIISPAPARPDISSHAGTRNTVLKNANFVVTLIGIPRRPKNTDIRADPYNYKGIDCEVPKVHIEFSAEKYAETPLENTYVLRLRTQLFNDSDPLRTL